LPVRDSLELVLAVPIHRLCRLHRHVFSTVAPLIFFSFLEPGCVAAEVMTTACLLYL
jgi:hypothetical protein